MIQYYMKQISNNILFICNSGSVNTTYVCKRLWFGVKGMQELMLKKFSRNTMQSNKENPKGPMAPHADNVMQIIATTVTD